MNPMKDDLSQSCPYHSLPTVFVINAIAYASLDYTFLVFQLMPPFCKKKGKSKAK